jgi:hypothetical protein
MVKRDAKIVDGIAKDRAQHRLYGGYAAEPKDVLRSLLIALSDNGLSTRVRNPLGSTVKVVQVGFCSVDLDYRASR